MFGKLLVNIQHLINTRRLKNAGQVFFRPASDTGYAGALLRLYTHNPDRRIHFLEIAGDAHNGARGPHRADKMRDTAMCITPDLGAGTDVMCIGIVMVIELIEHFTLAIRLHLQRKIACAFHALLTTDKHQLGTISFHCRTTLLGHVVRHHQDQAIIQHGRDHGQCNAGIAAGCFNQGIARPDISAQLRLMDHVVCRTVFDRPGRVVTLQFYQYGIPGVAGDTLQLHQRRITDAIGKRMIS